MMKVLLGEFVILIIMFVVPVVLVIAIVWMMTNAKNKQNRLQAEVYSKAIEKGQEIPPNFAASIVPVKRNIFKHLNTGIILIAVGLSVALFFLFMSLVIGERDAAGGATLGVIPFFIGIAYLIIYFIEKHQEQKSAQNEYAK
ncbi:MAG: DUF6249 domain-containing protein [Tannerella sp.]|jgi:preprotein translocase subunit YajC|nr:DUF6249 domain-containing protein [Tannerella sp.]